MSKAILLGGRGTQLLCAAVVLGLSAHLFRFVDISQEVCDALEKAHFDCYLRGIGPAVGYSAFVGAFGLLDGLVGIAAVFVGAIPWIATAVADGLACVFYIAGGIRLAVLLSAGPCPARISYCNQLKADAAFLFLGFLATLAMVVLGFLWQRRSKKSSAV